MGIKSKKMAIKSKKTAIKFKKMAIKFKKMAIFSKTMPIDDLIDRGRFENDRGQWGAPLKQSDKQHPQWA